MRREAWMPVVRELDFWRYIDTPSFPALIGDVKPPTVKLMSTEIGYEPSVERYTDAVREWFAGEASRGRPDPRQGLRR